MNNLKISQINRSLRKFSDYSQDVLDSDMNTFKDRVQLLMAYCKSDRVFSLIHDQLVQGEDSVFEKWLAERNATVVVTAGSGELLFPTNEDARVSTMYWLLRKVVANEIEADNFARNFYATRSTSNNEYISFFTDTVVAPLKRDLEYRFDELMDELPSDPAETVPFTSIQIIHSATNVIQQTAHGSNINQTADIETNNEIAQLFDELRNEINSAVQEEMERIEALEILEQAKELAEMNPPKTATTKRLLSLLPTLGNIGSIVGGITGLLG